MRNQKIKNIYNPEQNYANNFGKEKKSRNFAVQKTSAVSSSSQYSNKNQQIPKPYAQKNLKFLKNGSGKNTKSGGFGTKMSNQPMSPELQIVGQRSSVINKLQKCEDEPNMGVNLHNYFGQMEKQKNSQEPILMELPKPREAENFKIKTIKSERKISTRIEHPKKMHTTGQCTQEIIQPSIQPSDTQSGISGGINYF